MKSKDAVIVILSLLALALVAKPQVEQWLGDELRKEGAMETLAQGQGVHALSGDPVERDLLDTIMKAGLAAYSVRQKRPCSLLVTQERQKIDQLGKVLGSDEAILLQNAAAIIVVTALPKRGAGGENGSWPLDCAASTQAMVYAAAAQKLGASVIPLWPDQELVGSVSELFELPAMATPFSLLAVGGLLQKDQIREDLDLGRIHWNIW